MKVSMSECAIVVSLVRKKSMLLIAGLLFLLQVTRAFASDLDFSFVIFPDTQYLITTGSEKWPAMCKWVVDNKTRLDVRAVLSTGDITDTGSIKEFEIASLGFAQIENAGIVCLPAVGTHDYDNDPSNRATTHYDATFGPGRFLGKPWYGGNANGSNANYYVDLKVGERRFLFLVMEIFPRKELINWASGILDSNAEAEAIILTHGYLNPDGTRTKNDDRFGPETYSLETSCSGEDLWNDLIRKKPSIRAVICGHQVLGHTAYSTGVGDKGNIVHQIFVNYQESYDAWVGLLSFHTPERKLEVSFFRTAGGSGPGFDPDSPGFAVEWAP